MPEGVSEKCERGGVLMEPLRVAAGGLGRWGHVLADVRSRREGRPVEVAEFMEAYA